VRFRTRLAVVITCLLALLGTGAGMQAGASTVPEAGGTKTNGCVVVPSLELAVCISRF